MKCRMMLIGFFILLPFPGMAEQAMGRLFFTPEQRARMDVARQQERSIKFEVEQEESAPPPSSLTLNGVITRSDGKTTLWINNRIQGDEETGRDVAVPGRGKSAGQVSVTTPDAKRAVQLKVGQSIDMSSGQVEEGYRRPPPATPPASAPSAAKPPVPAGRKDGAPADAQDETSPPR